MKLAIMQPYFFPFLGYFALIKHSDHFIFFDTPQFIRHGWIERNRILKPQDGWQYIKVPLGKHSRETPINEIVINNTMDWKWRIFAQLEHYKKKGRYYDEVMALLNKTMSVETDSIVELNVLTIKNVMDYLGLPFHYSVFSQMSLNIEKPNAPDDWALNITKALKGNEYINPPGGTDFFDKSKYSEANIKLSFLKINLKEYYQRRRAFEPGLSIIDVMMFNTNKEIISMLDDYIVL